MRLTLCSALNIKHFHFCCCSQSWVFFPNGDKVNLIWLNGRCKTVVLDRMCVCVLGAMLQCSVWSCSPVKMTYFSEIQLGAGGVTVWAVTVRGWGVFARGVHDRDGDDLNTLTQEPFTPSPPPHISQYSAFTREQHCIGPCEHFKHEITCSVVFELNNTCRCRLTENIW